MTYMIFLGLIIHYLGFISITSQIILVFFLYFAIQRFHYGTPTSLSYFRKKYYLGLHRSVKYWSIQISEDNFGQYLYCTGVK